MNLRWRCERQVYKRGIVLGFEGNENDKWGWYHQQEETFCQKKLTSICDSTVQTTANSTSKQNNIPDLTLLILTLTNSTMSKVCERICLHVLRNDTLLCTMEIK